MPNGLARGRRNATSCPPHHPGVRVYVSVYNVVSTMLSSLVVVVRRRPRAAGAASCASVMCDPRTTARRGNRADAPPPPATPGRGAKSAVAACGARSW